MRDYTILLKSHEEGNRGNNFQIAEKYGSMYF